MKDSKSICPMLFKLFGYLRTNVFVFHNYSITFVLRNIKSSVTNCTNRAGMPRWSSYDVDNELLTSKKHPNYDKL